MIKILKYNKPAPISTSVLNTEVHKAVHRRQNVRKRKFVHIDSSFGRHTVFFLDREETPTGPQLGFTLYTKLPNPKAVEEIKVWIDNINKEIVSKYRANSNGVLPDPEEAETFHEQLQYHFGFSGITTAELSERTSLSESLVKFILDGREKPSLNRLMRFVKVLLEEGIELHPNFRRLLMDNTRRSPSKESLISCYGILQNRIVEHLLTNDVDEETLEEIGSLLDL